MTGWVPGYMPDEQSESVPPFDFRGVSMVFGAALVLYAASMAPVVFWGDSAEFATKAYELELSPIARGYPLHRLLAHGMGLALGDFAFGANLVSVVFGAATVALLYEAGRLMGGSVAAGLAAAVTTGVAHTFWSQAGVAEVYTLHTAFLAGAFVLLLRAPFEDAAGAGGFGLLMGMSLLHHRLIVFAAPGLLVWLIVVAPPGRRFGWVLDAAKGFAVGAIPFAALCILNSRSPPPDVGNAVLWWFRDVFMGGEDNAGFLLGEGRKTALESSLYLGKWLGFNLVGIAGPLAVWGALVAHRVVGKGIAAALLVLVVVHLVFPFRYDWTGDQYVFLLPLYPVASLLVAIGVGHLGLVAGNGVARGAALLCALVPITTYSVLAGTDYGPNLLPGLTRDAAQTFFLPMRMGDRTSRDWCVERFDQLERGAVLHCQWGDGKVYEYLQRVEGLRPDVDVVLWFGGGIPFDAPEYADKSQWISVAPIERRRPEQVEAQMDRLQHLDVILWESDEVERKYEYERRGDPGGFKPSAPPATPAHGLFRLIRDSRDGNK